MSRAAIALVLALLAAPAAAKDVSLTLSDQEQKVFLALLDAALKSGGLNNLQAVAQFISKYQQAIKDQPAPAPAPEAKPK